MALQLNSVSTVEKLKKKRIRFGQWFNLYFDRLFRPRFVGNWLLDWLIDQNSFVFFCVRWHRCLFIRDSFWILSFVVQWYCSENGNGRRYCRGLHERLKRIPQFFLSRISPVTANNYICIESGRPLKLLEWIRFSSSFFFSTAQFLSILLRSQFIGMTQCLRHLFNEKVVMHRT